MRYILNSITVFLLTFTLYQSLKIQVVGDINEKLSEVSAVETVTNSSLLWVIEDSGNSTNVFGLDKKGTIEKEIKVDEVENDDWEDLTSDAMGNLYIGDFGNNSEKRKVFRILKLENINSSTDLSKASFINFTLPKGVKSKDFEAFFLFKKNFYIFSKERKKAFFIKVPNTIGNHVATVVGKYYLKGKNAEVTSADISDDGETIILLNHNRVWKLTNFEGENFFGGKIEPIDLGHNSQKEGICFKSDSELYITDECDKSEGGNIYSLKL